MNQKREKSQKKRWIFGISALVVFGMCLVVAVVGMSRSVGEIREVEVAQSPTALLANAGATDDKIITLPVRYHDQISDECVDLYDTATQADLVTRQFEWTRCGYYTKRIEKGLASKMLSVDGEPVAQAGKMMPNRGVDFSSWFSEMEGVSAEYNGTLQMHYGADKAQFSFVAEDFYPLDEVKFSEGDPVNTEGHNRLFTMDFGVPFTALLSGEERFLIRADDDTFVYLNGELVVDMGGIHGATTGEMMIDKEGKVFTAVEDEDWTDTGVQLGTGEAATLMIFHADRDSSESTLELEFLGMNLGLEGGTQIAALSSKDVAAGYTAPLGESKVFQADTARQLLIVATVEGVMAILATILVAAVIGMMVRQKYQ